MNKQYTVYEGVNDDRRVFWTVVNTIDGVVEGTFDSYQNAMRFAAVLNAVLNKA